MKHLLTTLMTLIAMLLCSSCRTPSALLSNADTEAQEQAQNFIEAQLTRCGDSYYGIRKLVNDNTIYQFKNPNITVNSLPLSQADKLNGVTWRGNSTFSGEVWRKYSAPGPWSAWHQGFFVLDIGLSIYLSKQNGRWYFGESGNLKPSSYEKIDCSKLPQ